mmetsp:Transcript_40384/g.79787  ORF Transcript_40384/g.79787 Transcript_40384/m.79787 type:complete len:256 (+) Transcript_40384:2-769(+)
MPAAQAAYVPPSIPGVPGPTMQDAPLAPSLVNVEAAEASSDFKSLEASYRAVADSLTSSANEGRASLLEQAYLPTDSPAPDLALVARIEWRRVRRTISAGLTSHSMLDVELQSGMRIRFEKFADTGVLESLLVPSICYPKGSVYQGRVAKATDLMEPMRIDALRKAAYALGAQPYSLMRSNCHHFVRDLWNYLVIEPLRRYTHPDRIKANIAVGISRNLGRFSIRTGFCLESRSMRSLGCRDAYNAFHSDGEHDD